jgi:hypothetical protein
MTIDDWRLTMANSSLPAARVGAGCSPDAAQEVSLSEPQTAKAAELTV